MRFRSFDLNRFSALKSKLFARFLIYDHALKHGTFCLFSWKLKHVDAWRMRERSLIKQLGRLNDPNMSSMRLESRLVLQFTREFRSLSVKDRIAS